MRRLFVLMVAVAGCGTEVAEADPWVGRFYGTLHSDLTDCSSGVPSMRSIEGSLALSRMDGGQLFLDGGCEFLLDPTSDTTATFRSISCERPLLDGTPATIGIETGTAMLDGDELTLEYVGYVETAHSCSRVDTVFVGRP